MTRQSRLVVLTVVAMLASLFPTTIGLALDPPDAPVFISEIHYDNAGSDVNEAIEIQGPAGTDLTGWSLVLYNGSNGAEYATQELYGTIPDQGGGIGVFAAGFGQIQNGAPDGIALVNASDALVQFLSYEGTFDGVGGPADGITSTNIGVVEDSDTGADQSLQRVGDTWTGPVCASFGQINDPVAPQTCPPVVPPDVRFSEIHYDNAGTDTNEAIEVFGPAGTDLAGWSIALYNGNGGAPYNTENLDGAIPNLDGTSGVVSVAISGIQNGSPDGFALVDDTGSVVEFLSYEGRFTALGGPAATLFSTDIGVSEGSGTGEDQSLQRDIDGVWSGPRCASFGELNDPAAPVNCPTPPVAVFIHDVQGPGDTTPLDGQTVTIEGVVTGDFQTRDFLRGFNVQEEDLDADTDSNTSEGVFVFDSTAAVDVVVGDTVRVTGVANEFRDQTQIGASNIEVLTSGGGIVDPDVVTTTNLSFPVSETSDFETIEGMLVNIPQDMFISEYFNYDRFGEIVIGAERYQQPTAEFEPGSPEQLAALDEIGRGQITLDDGKTEGNPEYLRHPDGARFTLDNRFRGGDILNNVTGVISPSFGWRIQPTQPADYTAANPRPAAPDPVGGRLTVASFNVLNYFTTIDTGAEICGPLEDQGCRGADNAEELERQASKIVAALADIDADVVGLIEIENNVTDAAIQNLVDRLNAAVGAGTYDYVVNNDADGPTVGPDAIRVGILYKPASVTPIGADAVLDTNAFLDPLAIGDPKNRAAQAQLFEENATGETFSVVVNHLKSKGSSCGLGDDDPDNGQGNCNATRAAAAAELADWIATDPYFATDDDVLIVGDLNSYDHEEPIDVLKANGYSDLVDIYEGADAYSYVFSGLTGYLDYAMSSTSLTSQITGVTTWAINADEPDVFDYNTDFGGPAQDALFEPNAFRSSDHDPVVVGLDLDETPPVVLAGFDRFFATRHFGLFKVEFSCTDNVDPNPDCAGHLNGVPVVDGQTVVLIKARGRSWHRELHGVLYMKAASFELTVVGTDDRGNSASNSTEPEFRHWPW